MAVKDDGSSYPTETIISKSARKHYRIPVRSQHWQLRSLISAEKRHIVYFPGGHNSNQVQRLNVATNDCETIKLLTFAPRCLVAKNGWLCCGSENGEFVAIRLEEDAPSNTATNTTGTTPAYDPNARLPLDIERSSDTLLSLLHLPNQPHRTNKSLIAKSMKLAKDRVNCITLWIPPTFAASICDEAYTEAVAVLANNDRTVTLVSLADFDHLEKTEPLDVINYPDFVNRAIISPDGGLLVAILDDPYIYVHRRVQKSVSWGDNPEYKWESVQRILLKSQRKDDKSDSRGSFAACFSSSGAYLAVGTQHGTISIFDTELLTEIEEDPLITTFESSRPQSSQGAVRDMEFCPGPYDILAWTEDRGHIGLADVRTNFQVRQIIDINVDDDYEHISIVDRNTIDPRLLDARNGRGTQARRASPRENSSQPTAPDTVSRPEVSTTEVDYSSFTIRAREARAARAAAAAAAAAAAQAGGASPGETPSQPAAAVAPDTVSAGMAMDLSSFSNRPLDSSETTVLEAIRGDRRRARERALQRSAALSRNAEELVRLSNGTPRTERTPSEIQRARERANLGRTMASDALATPGSQGAERERAAERYRYYRASLREASDARPARRPAQQRLMDSINETVEAMRDSQRGASQRLIDSMNETVEAVRDSRDRPDSSYLSVLELLQGREGIGEEESSLLVPLVNSVVSRWEESAIRGTLAPDHGVFEVPPSADNTAGLAWSEDGRTLFVGAQNGIYELHVNVQARKFSPGITMS